MKASVITSCACAVAAAACLAALPAVSQAANVTYHVDLNVAALLASPATAPYYLDFQLNGDGLPAAATNSVTLTNFVFTLGSASGTATTYQGATGNLTSSVVLSLDSGHTLNELYQQFSATTIDIQFDVSSTQNGSGITPDQFTVQILDKTLASISTNAPDGVSLVVEAINGTVPVSSVKGYNSTSPAGVMATVVPEPTTIAAVFAGIGGLALVSRRKKS